MPSSIPSTAELRAICQPPEVIGRRSAEHWAGRTYMRKVSIHVTRWAIRLGWSANQVTLFMWLIGLAGVTLVSVPGLGPAIGAAVLIQLYLLLDCSDGEVARFRGTSSALGIYLDRLGHYTVEGLLLLMIGVRAGLPVWGAIAGMLALVAKAETDLITGARLAAGLPEMQEAQSAVRPSGLAALRSWAKVLPFHRAIGAVEASLLVLVAELAGRQQELVMALTIVAGLVVIGHLLAVVFSSRLR